MLDHLLQAVVEEPLVEDHWSILADWLEDHDDPRRAELLRLHRRLLATCCRAGTTMAFHTGDSEEAMRRAGWCNHARQPPLRWWVGTRPVGQFDSNAFGLFDTHGNVEEITADRTEWGYPVLRGGSWASIPACCRSAGRRPWLYNLIGSVVGCRVCLDAG
jgi:uncharacterized protein (TIGR02996 family)